MSIPFDIAINRESLRDADRFDEALRKFDAITREDPKRLEFHGEEHPSEYLLAQALCHHVTGLEQDPSEALLLASRSQHLRRWEHPRTGYPAGRTGYLEWRAGLKLFHAEQAAAILTECGYDQVTLDAVRSLNLKEDIAGNADCQILEDGLCLVFLQFQLDDIMARHPESKVIGILTKTARKMSPVGLAAAGRLHYSEEGQAILAKVLS